MSAGLVPSEGGEVDSVPGLFPRSWGFGSNLWCSLLYQSLPSSSHDVLPVMHVCVQISPFYDISHV